MRWGPMSTDIRVYIGDQWDGEPMDWAQNGWTNEKGDQCEGWPMSSNNVVGDLWIWGPIRREPMRWGDQWDGGPVSRGGGGGAMRWGTNGMGGTWVLIGGPMRWGTDELGDQWDGEPMRRGTNEMGDHGDWSMTGWLMKRGNNEMGDQWDWGPMRWGTNEFQ